MLNTDPNRYVVIDVATTRRSPNRGDRIIKVGALALEGAAYAGEFHRLVDAGRRISLGAREVNGITDAMLEDAPMPDEVFPALHRFIKGAILVAHNARFDMAFLLNEFKRLGIAFPNRHRRTCELSCKLSQGARLRTIVIVLLLELFPLSNFTMHFAAIYNVRSSLQRCTMLLIL